MLRGILHFVPWGPDGLSLDLMRRDRSAQPGVNDFLIVETIKAAATLGIKRISLNFAVFRSALERGERIGAGPVLRLWRGILLFASRWFQIESLYKFNAKFAPVWVPRFFVFPGTSDAPRVALAALEAEAFLVWPKLEMRRLARRLGLGKVRRRLLSERAVARPVRAAEPSSPPASPASPPPAAPGARRWRCWSALVAPRPPRSRIWPATTASPPAATWRPPRRTDPRPSPARPRAVPLSPARLIPARLSPARPRSASANRHPPLASTAQRAVPASVCGATRTTPVTRAPRPGVAHPATATLHVRGAAACPIYPDSGGHVREKDPGWAREAGDGGAPRAGPGW